ncbi:MAG: hypothetical protein HQL32_04265 [Planctomycetes bacterium]|nr:hypothetical protein [Planctomycetota bacterium]
MLSGYFFVCGTTLTGHFTMSREMKNKKKILVIGNKYHGKTTFAGFLKEALGDAEAYSTSSYLIYRLSLISGVSESVILSEKEKYRPELVKLGNAMCEADPGSLVSICLWAAQSEFILIDGVRRISEFDRVKDWFDEVIWMNRPSEPLGADNLELTSGHANRVILNDGSLEDLNKKAQQLAQELKS